MSTQEEKQERVKLVLLLVDDINVILETANYERKYTPEEHIMDGTSNTTRYIINSRERFRMLLAEEWISEYITTEQKADIEAALTLTRNKIAELFAN